MTAPTKADGEKLPLHLLPPRALEQVGRVLAFGAAKYGPDNWRRPPGLARSRYYAATLRHLLAWWRGEDTDPESGLPHLAHAACSVLFLVEQSDGSAPGEDDRPSRQKEPA
jgi:hypothetical protein